MFDRQYIKMGFNIGIGLALAALAVVLLGLTVHCLIVLCIFSINGSSAWATVCLLALLALLAVSGILGGITLLNRILGRSSGKSS